ncbi:hypothetical protein OG481_02070 [Streptomyces longwoodensis]|uniref:hypothetical protein n=1 Tax=Streptomyces longwoodensis TaxID=68231 RepID=UPI002DDAAB8F|nr:hypothetical protein [Streptomyces longwoodensis]WRY87379.1 hypothetical protein OG481_02070 [Streptomyces longwoodensis]
MSRLASTASRLADGSSVLARRLTAWAAAWVARGRRHDLTGWRAALGCWARLTVFAFGLYLLWRLVRAVPQLMWLLTGAWTALAWRAGRPRPAPAEEPAPAPREDVREATLEWIRQQIGDRQGVHLRDLLRHAQAHGMFEGMEVAEFRGHLQRWNIPVHRGVKVAGVPTWGVRLKDLDDAPSPAAAEEASTEASTAA